MNFNLNNRILVKSIVKIMEDLKALSQVAEFHQTFKHPILVEATIPTKERCQLRIDLIAEELKELQEAVDDNNMVEIADALCDLQYVLSGAVLEFGLGEKFATLFNEVQRSNMSKACATQQEADETISFYKEKGEDAYSEKSGDKINVHRASDHKVLKNKYYSPADLKTILEN